MGVPSKFTDAQKIKAVKRHASGESARSLAKEHGIAVPTFYLWRNHVIATALAESAQSAKSPATIELDAKIEAVNLRQQNERLKAKLYDLMVERESAK